MKIADRLPIAFKFRATERVFRVMCFTGALTAWLCLPMPAHATLTIEITQGVAGALPIAIVPFGWEGAAPAKSPLDVAAVITSDLARSGRFAALPVKDMLARPAEGDTVDFGNWRVLGSDNLVVGRVVALGVDSYSVRFRLYDVFQGKQIEGRSIGPVSGKGLRGVAHQISDIIYEKLTAEPGAFATQIAYVTAGGKGKNRLFSLWVADADGANEERILKSKEPILSPAWSPDGKRLAYSSLEMSGHQVVFVHDPLTARRDEVSATPGLNGAPAWSPDGKRLAVSLSKDGNPEIYVLELANKKLTRLTNHLAIDTEPAWLPDGKGIVFTSDRSGRPQIYRVSLDDGSTERLSFEGLSNARAAVSPNGRLVAMVQQNGPKYQIAVLELEGGAVRTLTDGTLDESPSFAPNGSMILYASNRGLRGVLMAVSVDGNVRQDLSSKEGDDVREPAWSPLVK